MTAKPYEFTPIKPPVRMLSKSTGPVKVDIKLLKK